MGIDNSRGEFIAQHDNDIEIVTKDYYYDLIRSYREFENIGYKVCSLGGSHVQGITPDSAPFRFARNAGKTNEISFLTSCFIPIAWNTASFVFRREFAEVSFDKRMCNSWGGEWFDRGYDHFISKSHLFWHIDSGESGAHVQKQYDKFRNYQYVKRHYRQFITEEGF